MRENERSKFDVPPKHGKTQFGVCSPPSPDGGIDVLDRERGNPGARMQPSATARRLERLQASEIMTLLRRQNFQCALTGRPLNPANASLDHITPICRGGDHTIENMQALLTAVNHAKGTLTSDEFIQLCREVVAWTNQGNSLK